MSTFNQFGCFFYLFFFVDKQKENNVRIRVLIINIIDNFVDKENMNQMDWLDKVDYY